MAEYAPLQKEELWWINSLSFPCKRSDSLTDLTWQPSSFSTSPAEICQLKWRFQAVIYMHCQITWMQGKIIYLYCHFLFLFFLLRLQNFQEIKQLWMTCFFPEPSLTFKRQKRKEQHLYFLHIMLLSGSHGVKKNKNKEIHLLTFWTEIILWSSNFLA